MANTFVSQMHCLLLHVLPTERAGMQCSRKGYC